MAATTSRLPIVTGRSCCPVSAQSLRPSPELHLRVVSLRAEKTSSGFSGGGTFAVTTMDIQGFRSAD